VLEWKQPQPPLPHLFNGDRFCRPAVLYWEQRSRACAGGGPAGGEIAAFYLIPEDYLENGRIIYVHPEAKAFSSTGQEWVMRWTLLFNLVGGDPGLAGRIWAPMDVRQSALAAKAGQEDGPAVFTVPYLAMLILYVVILMSSSLLLNSIVKEKENRVMEILMSSITPQQLLAGKIVALGIAGLVQTAIWVGTGYVVLRLGRQSLNLPAGFALPPSVVLWGIVFFLLGYAVYASLMAGLGALAPNMREANQVIFPIILPIVVPLLFSGVLVEAPHGALAVGLSLFPLTAPVTMITRLVASSVPWWQLLLSVGLLLVTALSIVRAVSTMFRAQTLLSGQRLSLRHCLDLFRGRA